MRKQLTTALAGAAMAGVMAFGARAADVTVMTSVPSLSFPFFVHMMKEMQAEGKKLGVKTVEIRRPELGTQADRRCRGRGGAGRQRHRHQPDRRQRHGAGAQDRDRQRRAGGDHRPPRRRACDGILAHVGADNVKGGEAQGEWVLANYPNGANDHQPAGPARRQPGDRPQQGPAQRPRPAQGQVQVRGRADRQLRPRPGPVGDREPAGRHDRRRPT